MNHQLTKGWIAFAGIGTALIHLALVIGSPLALGLLFVALGLAELGWGVFTLSREQIVAPRIARIGALAPVLLWSLVLVLSTVIDAPRLASYFSFIPMAVATLFELFIVVGITVQLRTPDRARASHSLLGLFVGAVVIACLTVPALAFTQAGQINANPTYNFGNPDHAGH